MAGRRGSRIRLTLFAVALGVVLTVLVSWGLALYSPWPEGDSEYSTEGLPQHEWPAPHPAAWPDPWYVDSFETPGQLHLTAMTFQNPGNNPDVWRQFVTRSGWPCLSLEASAIGSPETRGQGGGYARQSSLRLPESVGPLRFDPKRPLPLRPLWTGFAVDALIFSAGSFAVFASVGVTRRGLRRRRGRCESCGYDLGGLERCPECGLETRSND